MLYLSSNGHLSMHRYIVWYYRLSRLQWSDSQVLSCRDNNLIKAVQTSGSQCCNTKTFLNNSHYCTYPQFPVLSTLFSLFLPPALPLSFMYLQNLIFPLQVTSICLCVRVALVPHITLRNSQDEGLYSHHYFCLSTVSCLSLLSTQRHTALFCQ